MCVSPDILLLNHDSSIFRVIQPCKWFLHDGTCSARCCLAHGELAWRFHDTYTVMEDSWLSENATAILLKKDVWSLSSFSPSLSPSNTLCERRFPRAPLSPLSANEYANCGGGLHWLTDSASLSILQRCPVSSATPRWIITQPLISIVDPCFVLLSSPTQYRTSAFAANGVRMKRGKGGCKISPRPYPLCWKE